MLHTHIHTQHNNEEILSRNFALSPRLKDLSMPQLIPAQSGRIGVKKDWRFADIFHPLFG